MNEQKLKGMLGLALRARQAAAGMEACRILVRSGQCGVLLMDGAAGDNTRRRCEQMCAGAGTPFRILPEGTIGEATGKSSFILGIRIGSMAEQIVNILNTGS